MTIFSKYAQSVTLKRSLAFFSPPIRFLEGFNRDYIGEKKYVLKKNFISSVFIGDGQSITVCAPYWFEGQGVILEQEVLSKTPIKIKSLLECHGPKSPRAKKRYKAFCGTPCM